MSEAHVVSKTSNGNCRRSALQITQKDRAGELAPPLLYNRFQSLLGSPIPSSKTFSMRRVISPAIKQMKLSKSLTVLSSCGAVRTGPEDATDFVSTI
ncbi:hypothetical protein DY000_02013206 [Brassica cretica]|uniref:Uncharacterized protein n=1 Tax=Brassica cretica TaxID=69181 RepID=A0ABQ7D5I7_BRACR|nr:hypothetical protein DY000_02013206 [Brassica cretica]